MADSIVEAFKPVGAATVADVFRFMGARQQVLDPTILPLLDDWRICGRAFTQANLPARGGEDLKISQDAEEKWGPGDVIVESYWGAWGLNYAIGASLKGCAGAVIDGPYRDIAKHCAELSELPVFCRRGLPDRSSNPGGSHRGYPTRWMYAYNVPVNCGGVRVDPGDIVIGDADGVVIVPRDLEDVVLKFSLSFQEADDYIGQAKREGKSLDEANLLKRRWAKESGLLDWLAQNAEGRPPSSTTGP